MNIHRIKNFLNIELEDGTTFTRTDCTDKLWEKVLETKGDKQALIKLLNPKQEEQRMFLNNVDKSLLIVREGASLYIPTISKISLPKDFAIKILKAEFDHDYDKLTAYSNFWRLLSRNPDNRVKKQLFWFLTKWGMTISKSGLIVAYRNVDIKHEGLQYNHELIKFVTQEYAERKFIKGTSTDVFVARVHNNFTTLDVIDDNIPTVGKLSDLYNKIVNNNGKSTTVYTDHHSHTFDIKLGQMVTMPREECDNNPEVSCSCGLHVGAKGWLEESYYGTIGMRCLVNPADIVAVPQLDDYGKMRTCAYYPVNIVDFDNKGHIKEDGIKSGFEDDFINKICYTGNLNEKDDPYTLDIYSTVDKEKVYNDLIELANSIKKSNN